MDTKAITEELLTNPIAAKGIEMTTPQPTPADIRAQSVSDEVSHEYEQYQEYCQRMASGEFPAKPMEYNSWRAERAKFGLGTGAQDHTDDAGRDCLAQLAEALRLTVTLTEERDAARKDSYRLEKYAHHHLRNCASAWSDDCTCGLTKALAANAQVTK